LYRSSISRAARSGRSATGPCSRARTSSLAASASAEASALGFLFVTSSSAAVITAPLPPSPPAQRDRARNTDRLDRLRWRQVHDLTDKGTGLLECSRRLGLSLNTVKRYARAAEPGRMIRAPRYRVTMVDPYRDHLRARRAADPAAPVHQLLAEIREQGYPGSMNLPCRYITQGRVEADRPHLSPRRVTRLLLTRPGALSDSQQTLLAGLTAACPEMTSLAALIRSFAALLRPDPPTNPGSRTGPRPPGPATLPHLHAFTPRLGPGQAGRHRRRHPAVP
jgi:hypothetical protein